MASLTTSPPSPSIRVSGFYYKNYTASLHSDIYQCVIKGQQIFRKYLIFIQTFQNLSTMFIIHTQTNCITRAPSISDLHIQLSPHLHGKITFQATDHNFESGQMITHLRMARHQVDCTKAHSEVGTESTKLQNCHCNVEVQGFVKVSDRHLLLLHKVKWVEGRRG